MSQNRAAVQYQEFLAMRLIRSFVLAVGLGACVLAALHPAHAQVSIGISIDVEPPPLPIYEQPVIPAPG
jgi:hypothetical protein